MYQIGWSQKCLCLILVETIQKCDNLLWTFLISWKVLQQKLQRLACWEIRFCCRDSNGVADGLYGLAPPTMTFFKEMLTTAIHNTYLDDLRTVCAYNRKFAPTQVVAHPSTSTGIYHHHLQPSLLYNFLSPYPDLSHHSQTFPTAPTQLHPNVDGSLDQLEAAQTAHHL